MAKKKKTRKEKMVADLRHQPVYSQPQYTIAKSLEVKPVSIDSAYSIILPYHFVYKDLTKTVVLVSSILVSQLALLFLLKNHLIRIPIGY